MEQSDNIKQEIKTKIKSNAKQLMVFARYQLGKAVNDELFDEMDEQVQAQMLAVVLCDYVTDFEAPFTHDYIDKVLGDDDPGLATGLYIYCNWRVFATYNSDEELAKKYQAVCDYIDSKIFDQWEGEKLAYFIKQTD